MSILSHNAGKFLQSLVAHRRRTVGSPKRTVRAKVKYQKYYGLIQHETLWFRHRVGEAKYLRNASLVKRDAFKTAVRNAVSNGVDLQQALILGGLIIQAEAQLRTPVDTGALKGSAKTMKD